MTNMKMMKRKMKTPLFQCNHQGAKQSQSREVQTSRGASEKSLTESVVDSAEVGGEVLSAAEAETVVEPVSAVNLIEVDFVVTATC